MNMNSCYNMITIRKGVFETNSSSTHSMVVIPDSIKDDFWIYSKNYGDPYVILNKAERDKILLKNINQYNKHNPSNLITGTVDEMIKKFEESEFFYEFENPVSLEQWMDDEYLETDVYNYTTPKGEELKIYCKYGYNG